MYEDQTNEKNLIITDTSLPTTSHKIQALMKLHDRKVLSDNYTKENGTIKRATPKVKGKRARKIEKILRHNAKFEAKYISKD